MQDLWPTSIGIEIDNTLVEIMREQAELLGGKTKNLVTADVTIGSTYHGDKFAYYFYIVGPTLNNYHFLLFTVEHDIEIYPLVIHVDEVLGKELNTKPETVVPAKAMAQFGQAMIMGTNKDEPVHHSFVISSEDEFIDNLRDIFGSQRTKQVISSLLSMANGSYEQPQS